MIKIVLTVAVIWIVLINFDPAACIVNRKRNISTTISPQFYPRRETYKEKSFLKTNRPLWVLEDKVNRPGDIQLRRQKPFPRIKTRRRFISPVSSSLNLPSHYLNSNPSSVIQTGSSPRRRNQMNSKNQKIFPVFDADYGPESDDQIFIYRGAKAKMIFNTMMSKKKYPMMEPVPGQVLYPPYSPKFKPTPVVDRIRSESYAGNVVRNLTMFPFYTHEAAVDPRIGLVSSIESSREEVEDTNIITQTTPQSTPETADCHNCYHSYYSLNDVQSKYWSLPHITPRPESTTPMNLRKQIEVPNGIYSNHRTEETTPIPPDEPFRITYGSEIQIPRSKKRYRSVLSAKYGGFKTIYPIYTLNKLLRYKPFKNQSKDVEEGDMRKAIGAPEETWLMWNSRNREAHKSNYQNSVSIKDIPKNHRMSRMIDHKLMIK